MFEALPPRLVRAQIEAVVMDLGAHAAKTGMLATAAIVEAVAAAIADFEIPFVVVDPVMIAKSGDHLLDDEAMLALRSTLLRRAYVVTPNIPEAEALAGMTIHTDDERREAARRILAFGPAAVVIKGGHLPTEDIVDLLGSVGPDGEEFVEFRHERVAGRHTHGTGCTFAASIAASLALGRTLREAVPLAQRYIAGAIRSGPELGRGHAPMDHFWK
jgi:hydroxymethylpyrimidine/phosphomethylpyrimidine kinase